MKKKYINMSLFPLLLELCQLNNKALYLEYPNGYTSYEILFEGSKQLPRKLKKRIRKMLTNS